MMVRFTQFEVFVRSNRLLFAHFNDVVQSLSTPSTSWPLTSSSVIKSRISKKTFIPKTISTAIYVVNATVSGVITRRPSIILRQSPSTNTPLENVLLETTTFGANDSHEEVIVFDTSTTDSPSSVFLSDLTMTTYESLTSTEENLSTKKSINFEEKFSPSFRRCAYFFLR